MMVIAAIVIPVALPVAYGLVAGFMMTWRKEPGDEG